MLPMIVMKSLRQYISLWLVQWSFQFGLVQSHEKVVLWLLAPVTSW